jgi:transposase
MAKAVGVSQHTVRTVWNRNKIKPHLVRTFKVSADPDFVAKFWDVAGLHLSPPESAVVFCCDEKAQCQALERSQPGLPLGIGQVRTATHDYTRHGTTTLFAALDYATGKTVQRCSQTHANAEWLAFLKQIDRETPAGLDIHVIADNYSPHKHANVEKWLSRHKRMKMHFTPTSSSWLNLVERFFAEITRDCIREGSFASVRELEKAMRDYIDAHNENPKPFRWHADGEEILRKVNAARTKLGPPIYNSAHWALVESLVPMSRSLS